MVEFLFLGMIRHLYYSVSEASSWDFSAALKFGIFDKSFIPRILPEKFAGNPHLQQGLIRGSGAYKIVRSSFLQK
ncbi:uncharacterized protein [Euphorbia lathyris]|uniref:uncharacterized protein isoform X3 n=1 Tax=Euphorbia lathyris TaxID=212925 RepID=UPI0033135D2D